MNTRLADLKIGDLLAVLVVAGLIAGAVIFTIHLVHQDQQASRATNCDLSYPPGTLAYELCTQGKLRP